MTDVRDFPTWKEHLERTFIAPPDARPESTGRGVHHLALICSDVEQTVRFYQDVIGFPLVEVMENRDYPGSTHFFLDIGHGNLLAFFDFPGLGLKKAVEATGAVQHVAISTDQERLDAVRARLDDLGIPYLGPDRGLTDSIYVKDPDGIQIELLAQPLRFMEGHTIGG